MVTYKKYNSNNSIHCTGGFRALNSVLEIVFSGRGNAPSILSKLSILSILSTFSILSTLPKF